MSDASSSTAEHLRARTLKAGCTGLNPVSVTFQLCDLGKVLNLFVFHCLMYERNIMTTMPCKGTVQIQLYSMHKALKQFLEQSQHSIKVLAIIG